jgi:multiple sugar transport system substrate-binding protein
MLFLAFVIVGALETTGCGKASSSSKIHLTISSWGGINENAILSRMIGDFEKKHPNIRVHLERVPYNNYVPKLMTDIAGGVAPDVIFVEVGNFANFYYSHALQPLNSFIQADPNFKLSAYYPQEIRHFTVDQQVYVVPRDIAPIACVFYNENEFKAAHLPYPNDNWNWNQFLYDARHLTKRLPDGHTTQWGVIDDWTMIEPWIYSAGCQWVNNIEHPTQWTLAATPNFLTAIRFRRNLITKYKVMIPPASLSAIGGAGTSDLFINGKVAMFISGIWRTPPFRHEIKNFKWNVAMFPKGPTGIRAFASGGSGYAILKSCKHKQAAWKLIKYIDGVKGETLLAQTGLAQPAMMSVAESKAFLDKLPPLNKKMLLKAVKYAIFPPLATNFAEVENGLVYPALDDVWDGRKSVVKATKQIRRILAKNPPRDK